MESVLPIEDIHPSMKSWSAIVTVQEKRQPAASATSPTKYQKLVLVDPKALRVEAILFNHVIHVMGTRLTVFKKYKISNADVRAIDEKYQTDGLTMQWVISTKIVVEELADDAHLIPAAFSFTIFRDLSQYMELTNQTVDVLAVVISTFQPTSFTNEFGDGKTQKFIIINDEKIPLQLSVFNEFINNEGQQIVKDISSFPVVICRRLKVKSFNGISFSTRKDSVIFVDPPIDETQRLKKWAIENTMLFVEIIRNKTYARYNLDLFIQSPPKFTPIFYLEHHQKVCWIKASMTFENIFQRYWYMACSKCYKATDASFGYLYSCNKCLKNQQASPRCRFDVTLGSLTATMFGEQAEKLLTYNALEAMQYFNKNAELPLEHVHKALKNKQFALHIQPSASSYGEQQLRYTILHYYEDLAAGTSSHVAIDTPDLDFIVTPIQTVQLQAFENDISSPNICINLTSKFDEASCNEDIST